MLDIVKYLERRFKGLTGQEWEEYHANYLANEQTAVDKLKPIVKVAESKGISVKEALDLVNSLQSANTEDESKAIDLISENLDILPVLEQLKTDESIRKSKQQYAMAKILMRSRLGYLFWAENRDELADYEIFLSDDDLKMLEKMKPYERMTSSLQTELVEQLTAMLPEVKGKFILAVQSFAMRQIASDSEPEEDKEADPLD